jgi:hypothetical protein
MNLSEAKNAGDGGKAYDAAHAEAGRHEQEHPCTCAIAAKARTGAALYPSLIAIEDADPDCELHFPWIREDDRAREDAMRLWLAGYAVGFRTAEEGNRDEREEQ